MKHVCGHGSLSPGSFHAGPMLVTEGVGQNPTSMTASGSFAPFFAAAVGAALALFGWRMIRL